MPATNGLPIERDRAAYAQDRPVSDDTPADRSRRAQWMSLAQHGDATAFRALFPYSCSFVVKSIFQHLAFSLQPFP